MKPLRLARRRREPAALNLAPFIDMVFLLVIFLLVTTSFVRETDLPVRRPTAATAQESKPALSLALTAQGQLLLDGQTLDPDGLKTVVTHMLASDPDGLVLLAADIEAPAGKVVDVLDLCRQAGASNLSLAAQHP